MRRNHVVGIVMFILLGLSVWIENARAVMLIMDDGSGNSARRDYVVNIQPLDDFWPNLTMSTFGFKHRFTVDYSGGSLCDDVPPLGDGGCSGVDLKEKRILLLVMVKEKIIFSGMLQ